MRRTVTPAALLGSVALIVVGCGGSKSSAAAGSASAAHTVVAALAKLTHESYREHVVVHSQYDTSGLTPAVAGRFAAAPTDITVDGAIETPRRMTILESIPPTVRDARVVVYDGASYIALDGTHYRRLTGPLAVSVNNVTTLGIAGVAGYLTDVRPAGSALLDAQAVEHYQAALDPSGVKSLTRTLAGPLGLNAGALAIASSRVDIYLAKVGGQVLKLITTTQTTLDLAKLVAPASATTKISGTLRLDQVSTTEIAGIGAKVTVAAPKTTT